MGKPGQQQPHNELGQMLAASKAQEHKETLGVLDALRRSRKSRGGVGAPLQVPANLKNAANGQGIVITDADLDPNAAINPDIFRNE